MDWLMQSEAPLTEQEWGTINETLLKSARANIVGRRFIRLFGPLGAGAQVVPVDTLEGVSQGYVMSESAEAGAEVKASKRQYLPLTMLYKDFRLLWRDIAATREQQLPLDVAVIGAATAMLARAEDDLIFHGAEDQAGLLTVNGAERIGNKDGWQEVGSGLAAVVEARQRLVSNGAMGPYALVVSPALYAKLLRVNAAMGRLELEIVAQMAEAGVFQSPVLAATEGALVSCGPDVLDLAIGEDMKIAYLGPEGMDHLFRIFETLALRIRRPSGICVIS